MSNHAVRNGRTPTQVGYAIRPIPIPPIRVSIRPVLGSDIPGLRQLMTRADRAVAAGLWPVRDIPRRRPAPPNRRSPCAGCGSPPPPPCPGRRPALALVIVSSNSRESTVVAPPETTPTTTQGSRAPRRRGRSRRLRRRARPDASSHHVVGAAADGIGWNRPTRGTCAHAGRERRRWSTPSRARAGPSTSPMSTRAASHADGVQRRTAVEQPSKSRRRPGTRPASRWSTSAVTSPAPSR